MRFYDLSFFWTVLSENYITSESKYAVNSGLRVTNVTKHKYMSQKSDRCFSY